MRQICCRNVMESNAPWTDHVTLILCPSATFFSLNLCFCFWLFVKIELLHWQSRRQQKSLWGLCAGNLKFISSCQGKESTNAQRLFIEFLFGSLLFFKVWWKWEIWKPRRSQLLLRLPWTVAMDGLWSQRRLLLTSYRMVGHIPSGSSTPKFSTSSTKEKARRRSLVPWFMACPWW